jgi:hypothetical protein
MRQTDGEGASRPLAPSPETSQAAHEEAIAAHRSRKALAARLTRMEADAKQTYIETAASIGLNNSDPDCRFLRRLRRQWKMVAEAAKLAQEKT